ncbi:MAG: pyridoxal 5'-phosphate synthase glutaminase subunit PdxT [Oscillospiraceae bacterium]|nr:pyridoxal 5'-phosphate synthase glutaminase subunit PdxT [Oscillospiraceae bacterium]
MRIGVLAVQGAFAEHISRLALLGTEGFEIRQRKDLSAPFDGLILPGGESTAMRRLLKELDLLVPLKTMIQNGLPVFGTCAGMILLAKEISGGEAPCFGTLDITVRRNAYGRQLGSFRCREQFAGSEIEMPFIRAPYAERVGENVTVLAQHENRIIAVREGSQLAAAFHPELTDDTAVCKYFLQMVAKSPLNVV